MKSIHFDILHEGYLNGVNGLTLNELKKKLNIKFPTNDSELNFLIWFYTNFYNKHAEGIITKHTQSGNPVLQTSPEYLNIFNNANASNSYLKGKSLAKYIDYLELENTRKSSVQAKWFSAISIFIAIIAVLIQFFTSKC